MPYFVIVSRLEEYAMRWQKGMMRYGLLAVLLLLVAVVYYWVNAQKPIAKHAEQLELALQSELAEATAILDDESIYQALTSERLTNVVVQEQSRLIEELQSRNFGYYIFKRDSLVFWSTNKVIPYTSDVLYGRLGELRLTEFTRGLYLLQIKQPEFAESNEHRIAIMIPVKEQMTGSSRQNDRFFPLAAELPADLSTDADAETGVGVAVKNGDEPLFYLERQANLESEHQDVLPLVLILIAFVFVMLFLDSAGRQLERRSWFGSGLLLLLIGVALVRVGMMFVDPFQVFHIRYLKELLDISDPISYSVGQCAVASVLFLWIASFLHRNLKIKRTSERSERTSILFTATTYLIGFGLIAALTSAVRYLMVDTQIFIDLDGFIDISTISWIVLLSILLTKIALLLILIRLSTFRKQLDLPERTRAILALTSWTIMSVCVLVFCPIDVVTLGMLIFSAALLVLVSWFGNIEMSLTWAGIWIVVLSTWIAFLFQFLHQERLWAIQKQYAVELSQRRDALAEAQLREVGQAILSDNFIQAFMREPFNTRNDVIEQVDKLYRKAYLGDNYLFQRYTYTVHTYRDGSRIKGEPVFYEDIIEKIQTAEPIQYIYAYRWYQKNGQFEYIMELPVVDDYQLILIFRPRQKVVSSKVFESVLLGDQLESQRRYRDLEYGLYEYTTLLNGDPSMPDVIPSEIIKNGRSSDDQHKYYARSINENKTLLVRRPTNSTPSIIQTFSYLFCLILVLVLFLSVINSGLQAFPKLDYVSFLRKPTLRNKIQFSVIAVILFCFISIGVVTSVYFNNSSQNYHANRLLRKATAVLRAAEYEIAVQAADSAQTVDLNIHALKSIHKMDIQYYDLSGTMLTSTVPELVDQGFMSPRLNPKAFQQLHTKTESEVALAEQIGDFNYDAAYVALHWPDGEVVGYLGLPYRKASIVRENITQFLSALLSVYVALLLIAGVIALFVANSVTRPLTYLSEKIKDFSLSPSASMTPIEWENQNDEIGNLVKQYNKTAEELRASAQLLASQEREGAWREMAKQIAHEIKNPLTPMKLNIQHLQMTSGNADPETRERIQRISKSLIEQIDSLAAIASEFSAFAKVPEARLEPVQLNDLVLSAYNLFSVRDTIDMSLDLPLFTLVVSADRNQLMRVLNNIVKNAIQAIPDGEYGKINITLSELENGFAQISVSDTGVGISEEKSEKVFVPYFTTKGSGTGLGLAISKQIIDQLGGDIRFTSVEGEGTTFIIELPSTRE